MRLLLFDDMDGRNAARGDEVDDEEEYDDCLGGVELPLTPFLGEAHDHAHSERHTLPLATPFTGSLSFAVSFHLAAAAAVGVADDAAGYTDRRC